MRARWVGGAPTVVAEVEKHTAGEIVIVVARRSHDYAYWRFIVTLAAGFAATAIAAWIWTFELHAHPGWETYSTRATVLLVLVAQAVSMALGWLLLRTGASIRRIVPEGHSGGEIATCPGGDDVGCVFGVLPARQEVVGIIEGDEALGVLGRCEDLRRVVRATLR